MSEIKMNIGLEKIVTSYIHRPHEIMFQIAVKTMKENLEKKFPDLSEKDIDCKAHEMAKDFLERYLNE